MQLIEKRIYVVGWASSSQLECTSESSLWMTGLTPKVAGVPVESETLPGLPGCWPGVHTLSSSWPEVHFAYYLASLGLEQQGGCAATPGVGRATQGGTTP